MTDPVCFLACLIAAFVLSAGLTLLSFASVKAAQQEAQLGAHLPAPEPDASDDDTWEMPPVDPEATEPIRWWWN